MHEGKLFLSYISLELCWEACHKVAPDFKTKHMLYIIHFRWKPNKERDKSRFWSFFSKHSSSVCRSLIPVWCQMNDDVCCDDIKLRQLGHTHGTVTRPSVMMIMPILLSGGSSPVIFWVTTRDLQRARLERPPSKLCMVQFGMVVALVGRSMTMFSIQ